MKSLLSKLNLNELGFDLALLLMAAITWLVVFPEGMVPQAAENTFLHQNLIVLTEFVFAFVLGKEGEHFAKDRLEKGTWRKFYYFSVVFYVLAIAYVAIPVVLNATGLFSYAVGFFACIMGFMTGTGVWKKDSYLGAQKKSKKERINVKMESVKNGESTLNLYERFFEKAFNSVSSEYPVLFGLPFLTLFYGIVYLADIWSGLSGFKGILAFTGIILLPVIFMAIFFFITLILALLIDWIRNISNRFDLFIMKFFFPMLFAFLFLVWNNIYFYYIIGENPSFIRVFVLSVFLGLIPYRIMLMIKPPVNIANILLGSVVLVLYYLSYLL